MRTSCPFCDSEMDARVVRRPVEIEFRGTSYRVEEEAAVCTACGREFDAFGLLDPLEEVYRRHREARGIVPAELIRQLREAMHLTEDEFARLLQTSKMTVKLYESGALPSDEHDSAIKDLARRFSLLPLAAHG